MSSRRYVGFQLGRLKLQFSRDVLADAVHRTTTARAYLFFIREVVLMVDLPQLIPIDLAPLAAAMAFDFGFDFFVGSREVFRLVGRRWVQVEQMALPFAFAFSKTFSPPAKRPALVPSQFVQRGGVFLLEFLERGRRFVQHAIEFRGLLLRRGDLLLKLHRLLVGGCQELVALGQIVRQ